MLDDELGVDLCFDLIAAWRREDLGGVRVGVDLKPARARLRLGPGRHFLEVVRASALLGDGNVVARLNREARGLHLALEHAVHPASLLLLAKLEREVAHLAAPLLVHTRRRRALLERALGEALLALEEELHALASADPADRTGVASH